MTTYFHEIGAAEDDVQELKKAYLRRFGWQYTSSTPGCYWLWRRDFKKEDARALRRWKNSKPGPYGKSSKPAPYGVITADTDLATLMTAHCLDMQREIRADDA